MTCYSLATLKQTANQYTAVLLDLVYRRYNVLKFNLPKKKEKKAEINCKCVLYRRTASKTTTDPFLGNGNYFKSHIISPRLRLTVALFRKTCHTLFSFKCVCVRPTTIPKQESRQNFPLGINKRQGNSTHRQHRRQRLHGNRRHFLNQGCLKLRQQVSTFFA